MCISATLYPLHSLNLNMLNVRNRSDLYLKLEIIKKIMAIPVILIGIKYGMIVMLLGMVFNSFLSYLLNSMWSAKLVNYPTSEQLWDVLPTALYSGAMVALVMLAGWAAAGNVYLSAVIKSVILVAFVVLTGRLFKRPEYLELEKIVREQLLLFKSSFRTRFQRT